MFSYTFFYLFYFFVPGLLIGYMLPLARLAWLLSLPLSYVLLLANLVAIRATGAGAREYFWALNLEVLLISAALLWKQRRNYGSIGQSITVAGRSFRAWSAANRHQLTAAAFLFLPLVVYLYWAGPYTEVPADFWTHTGAIQKFHLSLTETGGFPPVLEWRELVGKRAQYWYALQAFLCYIAGISVEQSFAPLAMVTSLIVLVAVYVFTNLILRGSDLSDRGRSVTAAVATILFLVTFGTSIFSFVRYYTFAPTSLNYVIYLIFGILLIDYLGRSIYPKLVYLPLLIVLILLMALVHLQEAIFAIMLAVAALFYVWFRVSVLKSDQLEGCSQGSFRFTARQLNWLSGFAFILMLVAIVVVRNNLIRHDPLAFDRMIDLGDQLPFFRHLYIIDPHKQFYQTLTPWGYLVFVLFVLHWQRFSANPILVAGMLSPFYTVFNPIFMDFFLRFSWPQVAWRFLYMMPTAIAGAVIIYQCGRFIISRQHLAKVLYGLTVISLLLVLLFPLDTKYFYSPFSKYQSLRQVPADSDHRVWADLYAFLRSLNDKFHVLTDPVTGYTLRTLTQHVYSGPKFHNYSWGQYNRYRFEKYALKKFEKYDGWLFVINQRDGAFSESGRISRHWRDIQLQVHKYYPGELLEFVEANPTVFQEIWNQDGIRIYKIAFNA